MYTLPGTLRKIIQKLLNVPKLEGKNQCQCLLMSLHKLSFPPFFFKLHLFLLCVCMCVRGGRGRNAIDFALAHSIQIIKDNPRKKT